ncbi:10095_t:CDS:2 [Entrophospora sp. SA101]|nr:10095_t:CDS:2 [Entrophospora sp. SA101]
MDTSTSETKKKSNTKYKLFKAWSQLQDSEYKSLGKALDKSNRFQSKDRHKVETLKAIVIPWLKKHITDHIGPIPQTATVNYVDIPIETIFTYRAALMNTLNYAIDRLNQKGVYSNVISFCARVLAICFFKIPGVGFALLQALPNACLATTAFIAHLCNQLVADEIVALQILMLLLKHPTSDSVEVAVGFMREVGAHLTDITPRATNDVFDRFRTILHEANIEKRVQYMIEVLFQTRKDKFKDNPSIIAELDLVESKDQITHYIQLDDELDVQETLGAVEKMKIIDQTNTNIINLRRAIYLTLKSSLDFEESCHKIMKMNIKEGQEMELCLMIIECCSQERTYEKFFGLIGERLSKINAIWAKTFEKCFVECYETIHRYESNRLRNVSMFFAHILSTDAISWEVFRVIRLTEEDTTSSSRIFIKILFEELSSTLGMVNLKNRLKSDPVILSDWTQGLFPKDSPKNTRFAINYFTSIKLGALTDDLREHLAVSILKIDLVV